MGFLNIYRHFFSYLQRGTDFRRQIMTSTVDPSDIRVKIFIMAIDPKNVTKNSPVVCDGYVKYEEAEVHRSAIMQDFQDHEKKKLNGRLAAFLDFISAIFVMDYPWVRHYILFYIHGPAILHFLSYLCKYHYITKIQNGR